MPVPDAFNAVLGESGAVNDDEDDDNESEDFLAA